MKISKAKARYRLAESNARRCHVCQHIELHGNAPATCEIVQGTVERDYVCNYFKAR